MRVSTVCRYALPAVAVAALAGCGNVRGGTQPPIGAPGETPRIAIKQTFQFTGKEQQFTVPTGVTLVTITATGGHGGGRFGGSPGRVKAKVPVQSGETLVVVVGGDAANKGFNGGGAGSTGDCRHCNGKWAGGASDVRQGGDELANRVIVAGGGGGTGAYEYSYGRGYFDASGGAGGGLVAGPGTTGESGLLGSGGGGGTQQAGGSGGNGCARTGQGAGANGAVGTGGDGGIQNRTGGGGGGGGYYGGGGGGSSGSGCNGGSSGSGSGTGYPALAGGGGGGSSYIEPSATKMHNIQGYAVTGNGVVVIEW